MSVGKSCFTNSSALHGSTDATARYNMSRLLPRSNFILIGQAARRTGVAPPPNIPAHTNFLTDDPAGYTYWATLTVLVTIADERDFDIDIVLLFIYAK